MIGLGWGRALRARLLGATWLVIACGGATSKYREAPESSSGTSGAGGTGSTPQPAGGEPASQGGKVSPAGGVSSAGEPSMGGVPVGSAGSPPFAGTAGASLGCAPFGDGDVVFQSNLTGKSDFGNQGWASSWFLTGCKFITDDGSCELASSECPSEGLRTEERFPVGGPPGQRYKVSFRFSGLVEAKEYSGGKRDANGQPADAYGGIWDGFYRDGVPLPTERNAWKLTVYDQNGQEARHYYMNAFPVDTGLVIEGNTFLVQYNKSIVVVGGGTLSNTIQVPACRAHDNCGPAVTGAAGESFQGDCVGAARTLPAPDNTTGLSAAYQDAEDLQIKPTPELSGAYHDSSLAQPWHSQAGKITVLSIECTNDPVTTDYPDP